MKFRTMTFFVFSSSPIGIIMILRANTHNKSREWSGFNMISGWDVGKTHKCLRSTWWIFGKQLYRSMPWSWSMFWSGI